MNILSLQSSVAYGHVGNAAARAVLTLSGHELWAVDTVCFSNHPGYGRFRGRVVPPGEVAELLAGLEDLGLFARVDAVLTGYLGDAGNAALIAATIDRVRVARPDVLVLVDPVMGDVSETGVGRLFVRPAVPEAIKSNLVPRAGLVTPNVFELAELAERPIETAEALAIAAAAVLAQGPAQVVVTGWTGPEVPAGRIDTLGFAAGEAWRVRVPRLDRRFDGAGDSFAALLLAELLAGRPFRSALEGAVSALQPVLEATVDPRHLALIAAAPALLRPPVRYVAEPFGYI